jgi:hypothetical protein
MAVNLKNQNCVDCIDIYLSCKLYEYDFLCISFILSILCCVRTTHLQFK